MFSDLPTAAALERIDAAGLRDLVDRGCELFERSRDEIDRLNVFPVPDGDTGTNMLHTLRSARDEAARADGVDAIPALLTRGAVLGARGNSGVILSQVIRALADVVAAQGALDAPRLADALERARVLAYLSVTEPVEGTILSAIAAAAAAAAAAVEGTLADAAAATLTAVRDAVERTPSQLEALRNAGVVDAGAKGFEVFCEALAGVTGGAFEEALPPTSPTRTAPTGVRESGSLEFRFEVQYLLDASESAAAPLRAALDALGDSVAVAAADGILNVHVHTNQVGAAIEAGLAHGRPSRIEVTYFADQIAELAAGDGEPREVAVVAVLPGAGLHDLARTLGAEVVDGRAGALPSVGDLVDAARRTHARRVLVLPGHGNVVPTARQAAEVAADGPSIELVDTATSVGAVLAALAVHDPTLAPDDLLDAMTEAARRCRCGEVVLAVRDADTPIGRVGAGDPLGVAGGDVLGVGADPVAALALVADALDLGAAEVVTLVVGAGIDEPTRAAAIALVTTRARDAELDVVDGRQEPALFVLAAE